MTSLPQARAPNNIAVVAFQDGRRKPACEAEATSSRRRPVCLWPRTGRIQFPLYSYANGQKYLRFQFTWSEAGVRHFENRATLEKLKKRAEDIAANIANGEGSLSTFGAADRASYLRCLQLAAETGVPLEILVAEAVQARKREAARTAIVHKHTPEIVAELLEQKRSQAEVGDKWLRSLESMLDRFAAFWPGPLSQVRAHDINQWLRDLKGKKDYRFHHRAAAAQLAAFAIANNYLPRDWEEMKLVENPGRAEKSIRVLSPKDGDRLLRAARKNLIPFLALQMFCGFRHEELNPEECGINSAPLDWSDFKWGKTNVVVTVRNETGKTGKRKVILSENAVAWIKPYRKDSGPVCEVKNTSNAIWRTKTRAGLPAARNQTRNILRSSCISYKLATGWGRGQVAEWAGTSEGIIRSNYLDAQDEEDARAWFEIMPPNLQDDLPALAADLEAMLQNRCKKSRGHSPP